MQCFILCTCIIFISVSDSNAKGSVTLSKQKQATPASESKQSSHMKGKTKNGTSERDGDKVAFTHWLLKSEPESRIENGIDMKVLRLVT